MTFILLVILSIAMNLFTLLQLREGVIHHKQPVSQFTEVKKCSLWCDSPRAWHKIWQSNKGTAATGWYKSQRPSCLHSYYQTASSAPHLYLVPNRLFPKEEFSVAHNSKLLKMIHCVKMNEVTEQMWNKWFDRNEVPQRCEQHKCFITWVNL